MKVVNAQIDPRAVWERPALVRMDAADAQLTRGIGPDAEARGGGPS